MSGKTPTQRRGDERGAALILAMVFLLAIGLVGVATAGLAVGANLNTSNARMLQTTQANLESEVSLAIENARGAYTFQGCVGDDCYAKYGSWSGPDNCTPAAAGDPHLEVVCEGSGGSYFGMGTRVIDFYVCGSSTSLASCVSDGTSQLGLFAEVTYQDLPTGESLTSDQCNAGSTGTCGLTAVVDAWDIRLADS